MDIVEFLRARLDEDEAMARGAIDPERPGTHWHWFDAGDGDRPAVPDEETGGEYLEGGGLWLCTVEEFQATWGPQGNTLPAIAIHYAEEVKTGPALHIARHDPARVLREVEAKRAILAEIEARDDFNPQMWGMAPLPTRTLLALAAIYADHPDYDPAWR